MVNRIELSLAVLIIIVFALFQVNSLWAMTSEHAPSPSIPICSLGQSLVFDKKHDLACVTLPYLSEESQASGKLSGKFITEVQWGGTKIWNSDADEKLITDGTVIKDPTARFNFSPDDPRINASSAYYAISMAAEKLESLSSRRFSPIQIAFTDLRCRIKKNFSECQRNYALWGHMGQNKVLGLGTHALNRGKIDLWVLLHEYAHHVQWESNTMRILANNNFSEGFANIVASLLLDEPKTGKMRLLKEFEIDFSGTYLYPKDFHAELRFEDIPEESRVLAQTLYPDIYNQWLKWFSATPEFRFPDLANVENEMENANPYLSSAVYGSAVWKLAQKSDMDHVLAVILRLMTVPEKATAITNVRAFFLEFIRADFEMGGKLGRTLIVEEARSVGVNI